MFPFACNKALGVREGLSIHNAIGFFAIQNDYRLETDF